MASRAPGSMYLQPMEIEQFIHVTVWVTDPDHDDELLPAKTYRRMACIPLSEIAYMMEGINKGTTEVTLHDGDLFICEVPYDTITPVWEEWYDKQSNKFISFTRNN